MKKYFIYIINFICTAIALSIAACSGGNSNPVEHEVFSLKKQDTIPQVNNKDSINYILGNTIDTIKSDMMAVLIDTVKEDKNIYKCRISVDSNSCPQEGYECILDIEKHFFSVNGRKFLTTGTYTFKEKDSLKITYFEYMVGGKLKKASFSEKEIVTEVSIFKKNDNYDYSKEKKRFIKCNDVFYYINSGDTHASIAKRYGINVESFKSKYKKLIVGNRIFIKKDCK